MRRPKRNLAQRRRHSTVLKHARPIARGLDVPKMEVIERVEAPLYGICLLFGIEIIVG